MVSVIVAESDGGCDLNGYMFSMRNYAGNGETVVHQR
jgi:hypothetical protein